MGAWIETENHRYVESHLRSHPTWVRGLKHCSYHLIVKLIWSHPTWVRGLKLDFITLNVSEVSVAPYVGAWIETVYRLKDEQNAQSHPTWVRGLKRNSVTNLPKAVGRTLRGCVD